MPEFVTVPVPAHLVTSVMQLIVDREKSTQTEAVPPPGIHGPAQDDESREWSREQFESLAASDASSVRLFCQVLDVLADSGPAGLPLSEVAKATGVAGLTMQKTFGAVTRWLRKRNFDARWPIYWPDGNWAMTETNAALWREVRG